MNTSIYASSTIVAISDATYSCCRFELLHRFIFVVAVAAAPRGRLSFIVGHTLCAIFLAPNSFLIRDKAEHEGLI